MGAIKQGWKRAMGSRFGDTGNNYKLCSGHVKFCVLTVQQRTGTTSAELRREFEANTVNLGVCTGFFTEAKGLAENDQKIKFPLSGTDSVKSSKKVRE